MIDTIIYIYFAIAALSAFVTVLMIMQDMCIEEIDFFWDWVMYNLLWIIQPLKSFVKIIKTIF